MIIKKASQVGSSVIRQKAKPVKNIRSKKVSSVAKDLIDSMRFHGLVGMAAPQIGVSLQIFVTEIRKTKYRSPKDVDGVRVFINPKIISASKKNISGYEGCGSVVAGNLFAKVSRPASITIRALDREGEPFTLKAAGLLARVVQHEADHLAGKVFLDRVTDTKSFMVEDEYRKAAKR